MYCNAILGYKIVHSLFQYERYTVVVYAITIVYSLFQYERYTMVVYAIAIVQYGLIVYSITVSIPVKMQETCDESINIRQD